MNTPRISASSYSNTAPLIWSFLYGSNHGKVEIILDNAPARSAELLSQNRVDAALVPVIAYQFIDGVKLIPGVCVGARERVRSVCLVTKGAELAEVRSVSLDVSSRTSVALTKIIFREFLGFEPEWRDAKPDIDAMLNESDAALLIGDPALSIAECGMRNADFSEPEVAATASTPNSAFRIPHSAFKTFDLAELWRSHTGLGFVFAMWMTRKDVSPIDFAAARDEGVEHVEEIISNYQSEIGIGRDEMRRYLSENISYEPDESMRDGMELYFKLAAKHGLGGRFAKLIYIS
ncbi:MAG: menaquinone biosynthesis protein [Acidobacteriota bacterium]